MSRQPEYPIEDFFIRRWSPRAMSGALVAQADLFRLFEAARWAPSSGNNQPWRFVYGLAGTPHFEPLFNLLVDGNKPWCGRAGALVVVLSRKTRDNGQPARTHSLDTGAAWMSLALQGSRQGLVVHGMEGFDYDRARTELLVPEDHEVEMMIAIGHPGAVEDLPERYRGREAPSERHPVASKLFEGRCAAKP
jgi:nitroreductase